MKRWNVKMSRDEKNAIADERNSQYASKRENYKPHAKSLLRTDPDILKSRIDAAYEKICKS